MFTTFTPSRDAAAKIVRNCKQLGEFFVLPRLSVALLEDRADTPGGFCGLAAGSAVPRSDLAFDWRPVPNALYYRVRIVTPDGEPVWDGQTEKTHIEPPSQAPVKDGNYFVVVSAFLENGRVRNSDPVKFQILGRR